MTLNAFYTFLSGYYFKQNYKTSFYFTGFANRRTYEPYNSNLIKREKLLCKTN